MRLSTFNLYTENFPEPGETLVYNTFTGAIAWFDSDTLSAMRASENIADELCDPDYSDPNVGILVENRVVEEIAYHQWYEESRSSTKLSALISTTLACNLDCSYCYQAGVLDGSTMKPETAQAVAAWLVKRAREIGSKVVELNFYGGEPLLTPARIEEIVGRVRAALPGIDVSFGLITNGIFMTRELVKKWLPLGLRRAKVTLDGDETTHSITRRSKKGAEDSYATVFKNVVDCSDLIAILVNGNYQADTAHGFVPLIEKLRTAGLRPGTRVKFTPALAVLDAPKDAASGSCLWSESNPELMVLFDDEARKAGFDPGDPIQSGPCGFYWRHYYAIDPEGVLYNCPGFVAHPEYSVGDVRAGLTPRYDELAEKQPQLYCGDCSHRPNCAGGCVAAEWLRVGHEAGTNCEREFFDGSKDESMKRKYALAVTDTPEQALSMFPAPTVDILPKAPRRGIRPLALRVVA